MQMSVRDVWRMCVGVIEIAMRVLVLMVLDQVQPDA